MKGPSQILHIKNKDITNVSLHLMGGSIPSVYLYSYAGKFNAGVTLMPSCSEPEIFEEYVRRIDENFKKYLEL